LVEGNNELIKNLETVTTQANLIRQAAASAGAEIPADADAVGESDTRLSELRAVIAYLRKEKDIVDLQLEMHKTENSRVKGQVVQLQQDLDKTRSQLAQVNIY
jgi:nucleoprotein TPR